MATRSVPRPRSAGFPVATLPVYLTALVGRSRELDEVSALLRTARLVTLVGTGGTGKTRLAAAVASGLHDRFRGQVAWVDLATLADAALVAPQVAATLGLREQPGREACAGMRRRASTASR